MESFLENKKLLIFAGAGITFVFLVVLIIVFGLLKRAAPVTITYWGLWEPESVYSTVITDYQKLHPNVTVKYQMQSGINYRDRLTSALASGNGPDIFRIHNSWLVMIKSNLAPAPADFSNIFYPTVYADLKSGNQLYAVPLEIDTLVMYVNQDILKAGNVNVPTTWDGDNGLYAVARKLTVRDANGRITTAGAALGNAGNVDHWQDILGLMMLQSGVDISKDVTSQKAADALSYYTSFSGGLGTWDETQDPSTLAFSEGKVAFYFGPSWRYFDLKNMNPNLNFTVAPVPQLSGGATVNYASYWAEAVSAKSKNQKEAWDFLKYLSSKDVLTKLYAAESKLRLFGEPYSRVDMASLLSSDPNAGPVMASAKTAKGSILASATNDGDTGINSKVAKYFTDAVNSVIRGSDAKQALSTVQQGINQVLGSYAK